MLRGSSSDREMSFIAATFETETLADLRVCISSDKSIRRNIYRPFGPIRWKTVCVAINQGNSRGEAWNGPAIR